MERMADDRDNTNFDEHDDDNVEEQGGADVEEHDDADHGDADVDDAEEPGVDSTDADASDGGHLSVDSTDDDDFDDDDDTEFGIDQKRMPFTDHLVELRYRVLVCAVTIVVVFGLLFFVFGKELFHVLERPVKVALEEYIEEHPDVDWTVGDILIALTPTSAFITSAVVSFMVAIALTIPITIYHIWAFVAPGLKFRERKAVVPIFTVGSGLFLLGMAFCYFVVLRFVLGFLLKFTIDYGIRPTWNIGDTIKFEAVLMLVFGVAFELPLVIVALTRMGIVTPEQVAAKRRHAIVIAFIAAALLTPPDVVSQISLGIPLIILLEISIHVSKFFRPKGSFWDRWDDDGDDDAPPPTDAAPSSPDDEPDSYFGDSQDDDYGYSEDHYTDEYGEYYDEQGEPYNPTDFNPDEDEAGDAVDESEEQDDSQPDEEFEEEPVDQGFGDDEFVDEAPADEEDAPQPRPAPRRPSGFGAGLFDDEPADTPPVEEEPADQSVADEVPADEAAEAEDAPEPKPTPRRPSGFGAGLFDDEPTQ